MQKKKILSPLFLLIFMIIFELVILPGQSAGLTSASEASYNYDAFINAVDLTAVQEHVNVLSSLDSTRATGYLGNDLAAQYIYDRFTEYGLENVSYDPFSVVDCVSFGANVTVLQTQETVEVHPLIPNFISPSITPPSGISGDLVYVGSGELKEFTENVEGKIVLMDWNSESHWVQAAQLGAEAVIFLPPEYILNSRYGVANWRSGTTPTPNALDKYLWETPINFPRFYVETAGANVLMDAWQNSLEVNLVSAQRWTELASKNVIGFIEGDEQPEGIIILSSYYDSYSLVPTVAPGAQEAIGVSTLLELAKYLNQLAQEGDRPPVTLMFIAFGGHHQMLGGAMSFAENNFFFPPEHIERREFGSRVWRLMNLDLSSGSDVVYVVHTGTATSWNNIEKSLINPPGAFGSERLRLQGDLEEYIRELSALPAAYEAYARIGYAWNQEISELIEPYMMPTKKLALDHEVCNYIGPMGFSFTTGLDARPYYWTPFDTIEKINWENVQVQLECVYSLLLRSLNECLSKHYEYFGRYPVFKFYPGEWNTWTRNTWEWADKQFWITVNGTVTVYDEETAFWKPLTKSDLGNLSKPIVYLSGAAVLGRKFVFAEDDGTFSISGAITSGGSGAGIGYAFSVWVLDPETGNVAYVPDQGPRAYQSSTQFGMTPYHDMGYVSVFKASTIGIFDLTYPTNLGVPQSELTGTTNPPEVTLYETEKFVPPDYYATWTEPRVDSICLLAFPPDTSVIATARVTGQRYPFVSLSNATADNPMGCGFKLSEGEQLILKTPVLQYADDFYYMNDDRVAILERFVDLSTFVSYQFHVTAGQLIETAKSASATNQYGEAYTAAVDAWINEVRAYESFRVTIEDATSVVPFFAAILMPFTFLAEKLLFNWKGYRRAISLIAIFAAYMIGIYFLHPGFTLSASPANIVIGFTVLILSFPTLLIIIGESGALMKEIRMKTIGRHEIEVTRLGQAVYAFSTGIENMRKRRLRTILALITVVFMVSSLVNFTALSSISVPLALPGVAGEPLYEGIYIHKNKWGQGSYGISQKVIDYINWKYGEIATIVPRAWMYTLYTSTVGSYGDIGFTTIYNGNRLANPPRAFLGLTLEETQVSNLNMLLLPESNSRWFLPDERFSCIVSVNQAAELGIDPMSLPVDIVVEGLPFKVIGIMQEEAGFIKDLHEEITPIRRDFPAGENPWNEHLLLDEILILPFDALIKMGGSVASLTIIPNDRTLVRSIADDFYKTIQGFWVYSNVDEQVGNLPAGIFLQRQGSAIIVGGTETQIVPLIIVILNIFSLMLASVHERKRDIAVYGSLGLSPIHVAVLFIAETLVYGVVGAILGYMSAVIQFRVYELFFAMEMNYSSSMVLFGMGSSIAAVVVTSLYPALLSSRLVTPSLERTWKISTEPRGDLWDVPLPFVASSEAETSGIIRYLNEYLIEHETADAPVFSSTNVRTDKGVREDNRFQSIGADCRLAPYQVGVAQSTQILATEDKEQDRWVFRVLIARNMGSIKEWERLNRGFINEMREQLLLWRTLPESEKEKYITEVAW